MAKGHELRDTLTDAVVNIAISEIPWPNGTKPLPPRLWEAARIKLQARYRRATGEPTATLYTDDRSALEAELQATKRLLSGVRDDAMRLDNELCVAESRAATLARENDALRKALEPFVRLADKRDAHYKRRGGDCDKFPDTHPSYDIDAGKRELPMGVWRSARAALNPTTASKETPAFSAPAISPETQAALDAVDEMQRAAARMANVLIVGKQTKETSHGQD